MPDTLHEFVEALRDSQILEPTWLQQVDSEDRARFADAESLIDELLSRRWLTPLQADLLRQGRAGELVLGQYVILERLGAGGMGHVYKARHRSMNRIVALKVIRDERLADSEAVRRFHREIEAVARLSHPNIVTAHDASAAGGVHFLIMEYIDGIDLARLVRERGAMDARTAIDAIRQAAQGLQHAHEQGLIHRDVKPGNLMIDTRTRTVKLLDLGLARLVADRPVLEGSELTAPDWILGTPDYLAPEQAMDARSADIRADIYSLGCTLYHLLAGRPPFRGNSPLEKLLKHREIDPTPIEAIRADLPAGLPPILRRMMAKDRAERYPAPAAVADALGSLLDEPSPHIGTARTSPGRPAAWLIDVEGYDDAVTRPNGRITFAARMAVALAAPRTWWVRRAVAAVILLGLLSGAAAAVFKVVVRLEGDRGTVIVEAAEPDAEVRVDGQAVVLDSRAVGRIELTPGVHEIRVRRGDEELFTRSFRLVRGGREVINARWEPRGGRTSSTGVETGPREASTDRSKASVEQVETLFGRAFALLLRGEFDPAMADFTEVIRRDPKHARAFNFRGETFLQRHQDEEAVRDFDAAIAIDPHFARAYKCRGWIRARHGLHEQAIPDFDAANRTEPTWADPLFCRAESELQLGRIEQASADFRAAIKIDPKFATHPSFKPTSAADFLASGTAFLKIGQVDRAIDDLSESIRLAPDNPDAYLRRAEAYRQRGDIPLAEADSRSAAELIP